MEKREVLEKIAKKLRIHSLKMTAKAGSGHPTTCMSIAELMSCLFFDEMKYNPEDPDDWANDELVLSKGHAAPALYAILAIKGYSVATAVKQINSGRKSLMYSFRFFLFLL